MRLRHVDRLGAAMLIGALAGFLIGAVTGLSSDDLSAPVLRPFAYAALGVAVGALVAATTGASKALERGRRQAEARADGHEQLRREAHRGWIEGIDLTADAPPRPDRRAGE